MRSRIRYNKATVISLVVSLRVIENTVTDLLIQFFRESGLEALSLGASIGGYVPDIVMEVLSI
jgi:hypothetical protein